jgi:glutathione S-transferase
MAKPKLTYFDAPMSRGEECRLALYVGGADFDDNRIKRDDWAAMKPTTPFGSLPILEMPGSAPLAQSNAILVFVGGRHGLHPTDDLEAARHLAMMCHVEDLRAAISPSMRMTDEAQKKKAREELATNTIPAWGERVERQIGDGPFFAGAKIHVVDIKLFVVARWISSGVIDHVPANLLERFPKLTRLAGAVADHPRVAEWTAKHAKK